MIGRATDWVRLVEKQFQVWR